MYTEAKLGQLWQVLAPLLNAGVYFLIFGLIIKGVSRGVPDYLPFLVTGVFVFSFTQRTFISTSKVITDSLPLIRALKFPRAALPLAYVMIELQQMLLSMAVLFVLILAEGEPLTWHWLLVVPALLLLTMFNAGIGMFAARTGARVNDFAQLLPFLMRTWLYLSGVIYSIQLFVAAARAEPRLGDHAAPAEPGRRLHHPGPPVAARVPAPQRVRRAAAQRRQVRRLGGNATAARGQSPYLGWLAGPDPAQPAAAKDHPLSQFGSAYCHPTYISSHLWLFAAGWGVLALLLGFWYFWRKEVNYGRG